MNINRYLKAALLALVGLALAGTSPGAFASTLTDSYTNSFPTGGNTAPFTGGSVASWLYWYGAGYGNTSMTNDVTMDAANDSTSGSLQVVCPFSTNGDQVVWFGTFDNQYGYDNSETANGLNYSNITFDIKVAPGMALNGAGNYGVIQVGLQRSGFQNGGTFYGGGITIPASASNGWVHLSQPIDYTSAGVDSVCGVDFKYTSFSGYPKFPFTMWVDNVAVHLNPGPKPPPPTLSKPQPAVTGANFISTLNSGANHRFDLATVASTGYSWVGQPSVTYSWNIKQFAKTNAVSHQEQLFLIPGAPASSESAPDYNEPNCIFFTVGQNADGTAYCGFRYKTNEPNGNGMIFNGTDGNNGITYPVTNAQRMPIGGLVGIPSVLGTWSVTFAQTTNITITAPNGAITNFVMDPASAALYADPLTIYIGAQDNDTNGYGQDVVLSSFSVSGNAAPFSDQFDADTTLNTNIWRVAAADAQGVQLVPPGTAVTVSWTLPDPGFSLQATTNLVKPHNWVSLSSLTTIQNAGKREVFVPTVNLPSPNIGFFSLIQRTFSQLQVLLPGETAAPGTPTGKTGTPTPEDTVHPTIVTVNAVDANFFPVAGSSDQIAITSSDGAAILPNNSPLTNGTGQFEVLFGSGGGATNTVTATDVTDGTKTAGTSSVVIVN